MRRQKNIPERKGKNKITENELNKTEMNNVLHKEFKVMIITILREH